MSVPRKYDQEFRERASEYREPLAEPGGAAAEGEPQYGDLQARLFERPVITVPTITSAATSTEPPPTDVPMREVLRRVLASSPRRHKTQCAPRSPGRVTDAILEIGGGLP
jgi:hypothetical protein